MLCSSCLTTFVWQYINKLTLVEDSISFMYTRGGVSIMIRFLKVFHTKEFVTEEVHLCAQSRERYAKLQEDDQSLEHHCVFNMANLV